MEIPHVRYGVDIYLTSDSTGLEMRIGLHNLTKIPPCFEPALEKMVETNSLGQLAPDWRFMNKEEVEDYLKREREEDEG